MNGYFKNKFPFAFQYFSSLIEAVKSGKKKFPQGLIFEGNDTKNQYLFALELARLLNCQKSGEDNCNCINCKWIKSFSHPAINNVSEIHFKGDGDESKTVISVKQARQIESSLTVSSDYHRFFIFFSSSACEYTESELVEFKMLGYETNINFSFKPLTYDTFHPTTLNALLKSVEEPPDRVTFVFLTKSKEDILQTIVSRCFTIKLNSRKEKKSIFNISDIISEYPNIDYIQALETADKLQSLTEQNPSLNSEIVLNEFIEYLKNMMLENLENNLLCKKIKKDIDIINKAIKAGNANVSNKIVLETMMLKIARGY